MSVYLDSSVLLPILIQEPLSASVDAYMLRGGRDFLVGDFAAAEVASALSRLARMARLDPKDATERLADFDLWRAASSSTPDMIGADIRLANTFVRRFDLMLRAPDAVHLAMAQRLGAVLATLDQRLARAARVLGIAVEEPR